MAPNYRSVLIQERRKLTESLGMKADAVVRTGPVADEDQAQVTHDEFVAFRLNYIEYRKLRQVDDALQRLDDGDYGLCGRCEKPIAPRRLEVIPWAEHCVSCQELISEEGDHDDSNRSVFRSLAEVL